MAEVSGSVYLEPIQSCSENTIYDFLYSHVSQRETTQAKRKWCSHGKIPLHISYVDDRGNERKFSIETDCLRQIGLLDIDIGAIVCSQTPEAKQEFLSARLSGHVAKINEKVLSIANYSLDELDLQNTELVCEAKRRTLRALMFIARCDAKLAPKATERLMSNYENLAKQFNKVFKYFYTQATLLPYYLSIDEHDYANNKLNRFVLESNSKRYFSNNIHLNDDSTSNPNSVLIAKITQINMTLLQKIKEGILEFFLRSGCFTVPLFIQKEYKRGFSKLAPSEYDELVQSIKKFKLDEYDLSRRNDPSFTPEKMREVLESTIADLRGPHLKGRKENNTTFQVADEFLRDNESTLKKYICEREDGKEYETLHDELKKCIPWAKKNKLNREEYIAGKFEAVGRALGKFGLQRDMQCSLYDKNRTKRSAKLPQEDVQEEELQELVKLHKPDGFSALFMGYRDLGPPRDLIEELRATDRTVLLVLEYLAKEDIITPEQFDDFEKSLTSFPELSEEQQMMNGDAQLLLEDVAEGNKHLFADLRQRLPEQFRAAEDEMDVVVNKFKQMVIAKFSQRKISLMA